MTISNDNRIDAKMQTLFLPDKQYSMKNLLTSSFFRRIYVFFVYVY